MRLGAYACALKRGSVAYKAYMSSVFPIKRKKGTVIISERHRHRYELNNAYRGRLEEKGLVMSGINPDRGLVEIIELPKHKFFVGTQFHPEFQSRPLRPHPLFSSFIKAAIKQRLWGRNQLFLLSKYIFETTSAPRNPIGISHRNGEGE